MSEAFVTSGESSDITAGPAPRLQGLFIPSIDNAQFVDGFGLVSPWGGGGTARRYGDYGISTEISRQSTQLNDLASGLILAEGGGISFGTEGPQGLRGFPGRDGIDGIIHIMGLNLPQNSNFLTALPHNIDQINQLGTAVNKSVYTDTYTTVVEGPTGADLASGTTNGNTLATYGSWTEREITFDTEVKLSYAVTDSTKQGAQSSLRSWYQSFIPASTLTLTGLEINIDSIPSGTARASIYFYNADADGKPTGSPLGSGSLGALVTTNTGWQGDLTLSGSVTLTAGNRYCFRLAGFISSGEYHFDFDSADGYTDGTCWYWSGSEYVAQNGDINFKLYGIGFEIVEGQKYSIIVKAPDVVGSAELYWSTRIDNPYANGDRHASSDSGSSWTKDTDDDVWFKTKAAGAEKDDGSFDADGFNRADEAHGATWIGQTFTASSSYTLSSVVLKLAQYLDFGGSVETVTVSIRATNPISYSEATWAEFALTSAGRAILDDANAAAQATTLGLGIGNAVTHDTLTLSSIAAEASDVDKFLVDSTGVIKFRTGAEVLSDIGAGSGDSPTFTGLTLSGLTQGSVVFAGSGGVISQDNSNLFWDTTNTRLGIGINSGLFPAVGITVSGEMDLIHASSESDDHAFEIDVDAAGYGDVKAVDIDYITGDISTGEDEAVILINIDEIEAAGGDVFGLEILATEGAADSTTTVYGLKAGVLVGPIHQDSGTFENPTIATNDTVADNVPYMIDGLIGNVTPIFSSNPNDDDYILIGDIAVFEEIEFIITTGSSGAGIKPKFEYSRAGSNLFTEFFPVDGTNGFRNTGVVAWDADDLTNHGLNTDTAPDTYCIKITRQRPNLTTTPVLGFTKVAATTEYVWDKDGDVNFRNLTVTQVLLGADPTNVSHSVTKSYADALVAGAFWTDVTVGTVADVDLSTELETGDTIDDYILVEGDRVLVKEQTDQTENGLYTVPASGAASRATDADSAGEIESKKCIPLNGTTTKHRLYFCITGDIELGVTDIKFAEVTQVSAHNTLSGIQGGQADQYYHLTNAEHTALIKIPALAYASDSFIKVTAEDTYAIRTLSQVRTDLGLVIGTNVLAEQTIGIADDNLLEVDDTDAANTDYARFTANGLQGRDTTEVKTDLGLVIGTNVQAHDAELDSLAALSYVAASFVKMTGANTFALRTIGETADDLEATIDHDNLDNGGAHDYSYISGNDGATDVTAAQLEELTNSSETTLHSHAGAASFGRPLILTPQSNCGPVSDFATQDTIAGGSTPNEVVSVLDFDPDATEYADFKIDLPPGYAGGGLTITVKFSMTSDHDEGTPHKVRWEAAFARIDDDGIAISADHAYDFNGVSAVVPSVVSELSYENITFTNGADMDSLAAGEMAFLRIRRKHDHGDDNATGDAELQMIVIKET